MFGERSFTPEASVSSPTETSAEPLGSSTPIGEPCAITFGHDGEPNYVQGPYDDASLVLETLGRSVGAGNFHFTVSAADIAGEPGYEDMDMLIEA